jgi:hypothetical protein
MMLLFRRALSINLNSLQPVARTWVVVNGNEVAELVM